MTLRVIAWAKPVQRLACNAGNGVRWNVVVLDSALRPRPNSDAEVIAARGECAASGVKRALPHCARVAFERVEAAPIVAQANA